MNSKLNSVLLTENIKHDLSASIVVFFVAVPLCLGVALASGAPLFSGIMAGIVGGIVVSAISNSRLGVSGPAAGLTVIVLNSISALGGFETFLVAVVLAGVFQIIFGLLRAGIIGYLFPMAVIRGMLTAIGVIIILKQLPHSIGYDRDYEVDLYFWQSGKNGITELSKMFNAVTPGAAIVCLLAMVIMFVWEKEPIRKHPVLKLIQGPFLVVVLGILYQLFTSASFPYLALGKEHLVNVPVTKNVFEFFNQVTTPDFSVGIMRVDVWVTAITISIVASLESLLSVEATDKLDPKGRTTDTNRELLAQGTGNIISGLLGGLPITQVILRSSANIHSGAKTKLSAILHGILILLCVISIPTILNLVPLAVLAAILLLIGYKLVSPSTFLEVYKLGWSQFAPFVMTIIGVVFTDLLSGIAVGMAVAIIFLLVNSIRHSHFLKTEEKNGDRIVKLILAEKVFFLNKGTIRKELNKIPSGSQVIIDGSRCVSIDHDVKETISEFRKSAFTKKIKVDVIL